ncbi:MAG: phosphomannomutase/phosphoglucomutase, partial [Alphaproteobacteria bacterium]|nr:phosphomannomutase/phosphoglucomutase [Alphaproteobacteria bacterium]
MSDKHDFNATLLREYDIRGVVGDTLFEADARAIGRAFGTRIIENGGTSVATGRDGRHSSPAMELALAEGLASTGLTVHRVGGCATPGLYFAVHHLGIGGGVMVTGSHNPPDYNGFKMMIGTGPFFGADIQALGALAAAGEFASGAGKLVDSDIAEAYVARLLEGNRIKRPLSVVWDCGNGAAGPATVALCERLAGEHRILFPEVDGNFPNHHPDPTVIENLETLIQTVADTGANLGIAFDGDGDRIGVIDDKGRVLWGDQLIAILAEDVLAERPGSTIIADVKASQILFDRVRELGGKPEMWRTGHSLIKTRMAETGAPLAGEMSGHIFFKDRYYGFDDALYAAIRLIETLSSRDEPLSAMRDRLPQMVNTPELRFPCSEERKFSAVEDVKAWLEGQDGL